MGQYIGRQNKEFCDPLQIEADIPDETFVIPNKRQCLPDDMCRRDLPILQLKEIVLTPGQTLPLFLLEARHVNLIRHVLSEDNRNRAFGILTTRFIDGSTGEVPSVIGCMAELDHVTGLEQPGGITVKATGRHAFRVLSTRRQMDGNVLADVYLLVDRVLHSPPEGTLLASQRKSLFPKLVGRKSSNAGDVSSPKCAVKRKADSVAAGCLTYWPSWVYQQYDVNYLMSEIDKKQFACQSANRRLRTPTDPTELSLWLAANLPLDDNLKLRLLGMQCTVQRLRSELNFLNLCTSLCCKVCHLLVANIQDMFTVRGISNGPLAIHVNPGGELYELMTVFAVSGVRRLGPSYVEDTWFPGFEWTVLDCLHCSAHIGWRFKRTGQAVQVVSREVPDIFWGICRSSILPGVVKTQLPGS